MMGHKNYGLQPADRALRLDLYHKIQPMFKKLQISIGEEDVPVAMESFNGCSKLTVRCCRDRGVTSNVRHRCISANKQMVMYYSISILTSCDYDSYESIKGGLAKTFLNCVAVENIVPL